MKEALRSLKNDISTSFFYWLTFTLTSMFIFLFFVISMSEGLDVTMVNARDDIATNLLVFAVILCSFDIIFTNDFFIKRKAKELAVRLVCGATYLQLAGFLLGQTLFLLILAVPLGILGGIALIPLLNQLISSSMNSVFHISITFNAMLWTALVIGYVLFWALLLNLAFAYRNSASQLLNEQGIKLPAGKLLQFSFKPSRRTSEILAVCLFLVPVILMYLKREMIFMFSVISLIGFNSVYHEILLTQLEDTIQKHIDDPLKVAYLGFFRNDLKVLKINLVLFLVSCILLVAILMTASGTMEIMLVLVTYVAMSALLSMTVMFKFLSEIPNRIRYYQTLSHIGYMQDDTKRIIRKEVYSFFGFVMVIIIFYLANITLPLVLHGLLSLKNALILPAASLIPLILCGLISQNYYTRTIQSNMIRKGDK